MRGTSLHAPGGCNNNSFEIVSALAAFATFSVNTFNEMMDKLFKFCCRLCLHDGSTHRLLDILSVKGLKENISNVFNIEIAEHDACTTNICLNCFNETFNMQKQFQLYEEQKRTILENQTRLQENPLEATSDPAPLTNTSAGVAVTTSDENNVNAAGLLEKQSQLRKPNDVTGDASSMRLKEVVNHQQDKPKKVKTSQKDTAKNKKKVPEEPKKKVVQSANIAVAIVANQTQKKQSGAENTNECVKDANADQVLKQKPATLSSSALKRRIESQANDAAVSNISTINNATAPQSTDGNNPTPNNAQSVVLNASNTVQSIDECNEVNVANIQLQEAQVSSDEPPSFVIQKVVPVQGATLTKETTTTASATLANNGGMVWINGPVIQATTTQSNYGNHAGQSMGQSVVAPVYSIPAIAAAATVASSMNKSASISSSVTSTANQAGRSGVTTMQPHSISQAQINSNHTSTIVYSTFANVNQGSSLHSVSNTHATSAANTSILDFNNTPGVAVVQPSLLPNDNEANVYNNTNNSTSPAGATKKRRHSTYIRVSSNLFDEPPERAQFAMLNNNRLLRNFEEQATDTPPAQIVRLPVLPPGQRVQTMMNPTTLSNNNALNQAVMNKNYQWQNNVNGQHYRPTIPAGSSMTQASTTSTSVVTTGGTVGGVGDVQSAVNRSSMIHHHQQSEFRRISGSTLVQQGNVVPNNGSLNHMHATSINTTGMISNSFVIRNKGVNATNTTLAQGSTEQTCRPCFRCNICTTYYLIEHNLQSHLQRIHNVEKNDQTCSKIYDANILNKLLTRFRRKSIADPLTPTNNRAQLN